MARDILAWGIDWMHKKQEESVNEPLVLSWTTDEEHSLTVYGSLVDEAGRVIPGQGAKTVTEFTRFLITAVQLSNVPLQRGLRVAWNSSNYEVATDGNKCWYFNDALHRGIILVTKNVSN